MTALVVGPAPAEMTHVCSWVWLDTSTNPSTPTRVRTDYQCDHCGQIRTEYTGRAR